LGTSEPSPRAITSSIYYLWKAPDKRKILENEINKVIPKDFDYNNLTAEQIDSIDYLNYFVKEVLRTDPPV